MPTEYRKGKFLIGIPVSRDLLRALDRRARDNERSRAAEVRIALRNHLNLTGKPSTKQSTSEPKGR